MASANLVVNVKTGDKAHYGLSPLAAAVAAQCQRSEQGVDYWWESGYRDNPQSHPLLCEDSKYYYCGDWRSAKSQREPETTYTVYSHGNYGMSELGTFKTRTVKDSALIASLVKAGYLDKGTKYYVDNSDPIGVFESDNCQCEDMCDCVSVGVVLMTND